MKLIFGILFSAVICSNVYAARLPLEATPIVNNGVYRIENQEDGAFLSAVDGGKVAGGEYSGAPGQKWLFKESGGKDTYTITPQANENNSVSVNQEWQMIKVSHGKRLFRNTKTGLCITNLGRGRPVQERECGRDNPKQRWNVQTTSSS